jgi:hypothetical protein
MEDAHGDSVFEEQPDPSGEMNVAPRDRIWGGSVDPVTIRHNHKLLQLVDRLVSILSKIISHSFNSLRRYLIFSI